MVPDINLLPNLENKKSTSILLYVFLCSITAILLAYMIVLYFGAKSDLTTLSKQEEILTAQRDELQQELEVINTLNSGSLAQSVKFVESVSYPVTPLIAEIQLLLPGHTFVRTYSFDEKSATVTTDFETMDDISKYVEKLKVSDLFSDVQVDTIGNFDIGLGQQTEDQALDNKFKEIPRYTVTYRLFINHRFLTRGGAE